ncbi:MAG TPA: hypothetical protein VF507_00280, partial [Pyrinomonadaceae bacterium]
MSKRVVQVGLIILAALLLRADAGAQGGEELREEFHQTYPLSAGGRVSLENLNGAVHVSGWDRNEVRVDAVKRAFKRERLAEVEIIVDASPDAVRVRTRYPEMDQSFYVKPPRSYDNPATVEYTLTVPRGARIDSVQLINGALDIKGLAGDVSASSINGSVTAQGLVGTAKLSTINGKLEATFDRLEESKPVTLSSVNGSVAITIPSDSNAQVRASTVHGRITNDFNLPVRDGEYV